MGFRDSPGLSCKILKPVLAYLRRKGHISYVFIDGFFLIGRSFNDGKLNVQDTPSFLKVIGFEISEKKKNSPRTKIN